MNKSLRTNDDIQCLVEKYSDKLIRIAYTYLKNRCDAEDIAQTVFLKCLEKELPFENDEHEKAWFIRVTINLCKNSLRALRLHKSTELDETIGIFTPMEHDVMDAITRLPVKYRSLIFLYYYEDYSIAQIAATLRQKETTTGSQLYRARQLLKSMLTEDIDDE